MIDPITLSAAVTGATTAYNAIKKAIVIGKEVEEITSEIGKWMGCVSDIDNIHKSANNPSMMAKLFNGSVEQVALESFAARKKVEKQRQELKNFMIAHYGMRAWDDLIREEGKIRSARQKAVYAKEEQKEKLIEYTVIGVAGLIGLSAVGWMVWIITMNVGS
jgi:hypothetical protein